MYIRYLLACLLAVLVMPTSLIMAMSESDIEAHEQSMEFPMEFPAEDDDNAMNEPSYEEDPEIEEGDIDEDTTDTED